MANQYRLLNRDGSFNIVRRGLRRRPGADLYHKLLSTRWSRFFGVVFLFYMGLNLVYATSYFFFGELQGAAADGFARFQDCFFFSVQTLATIGYGRISPVGIVSNSLVTVEALNGLLGFAIVTGMLFARFSRPTARVHFSSRALVATHDGIPSFMFRIVNARANQIAEAMIGLSLVINESTSEGEQYRTIHDLKLERERTAIFAASWLVVHPIDSSSPLHGHTRESLEAAEAEIFATVTGIDETLAQTIHTRYSYIASEIVWGARFEDMLSRTDEGKLLVDVGRLNEISAPVSGPEAGSPGRPAPSPSAH
jgi:inward rectifier potassium channel